MKLIDARLQQDKLTEPHNDSAVPTISPRLALKVQVPLPAAAISGIYKRIGQALHAAIEQGHLTDADRLLADVRSSGRAGR